MNHYVCLCVTFCFQPHDEPILKHLQDVDLKLNEKSVSHAQQALAYCGVADRWHMFVVVFYAYSS